jgi:hypothetical protein
LAMRRDLRRSGTAGKPHIADCEASA